MSRAKGSTTIATTHSSNRGQHPRMFSSSSSSSSISSSSSCSLSPGPQQQKPSAKTTITAARKRSSWMLSHHEKPGWEDTAATPFEGQQKQHHCHHQHQLQEQTPKHHHQQQRHQRTGSCDQTVVGVPLTSPHSPPSSPLPLGLHKQNSVPTNITATTGAGADMDSEDDHHRRYKQLINGRTQERSRVTSDGGYSSGHSASISSARKALQSETTTSSPPQRPRRKEGSGTGSNNIRTATTPTAGNDIPARPRFSVSTVVNPRPQFNAVGTASREAPKEGSIKSTTTARSSRSAKDSSITPRATKSTTTTIASSAQPTTKSVSTTRISKTRSPTTITTTTTTTTRRVASTIITMGPHLDREHRKLTASASASAAVVVANAGAHSTKTSSSRKERTARASNMSPSGSALDREGGRQAGTEPSIELAGAVTTNSSSDDNKNTAKCLEDAPIPALEPTTTPLLPALQMEDEEEPRTEIDYSRPAMDTTPTPTVAKLDIIPKSTSTLSPPSSPSSPSPLPPPATESLPILSSPIIVASHPQTPPPPQTITPLKTSSDIVYQAPDTPSITPCSPPKEMASIASQPQQESAEGYLAKPLAAVVFATPMVKLQLSPRAESKIEEKTTAMTTAAYTPPVILSGSPRIFRARHETSSSRVLSVPQCEIKAEGGEQERPAELPTTIISSKSLSVAPTAAVQAHSTLTTVGTKEISKTLQKPQQPFRKNIWNGRMESRFTKPQNLTTTTTTTTTTTATATKTTIQPEEEAVPTTQKNAPTRTGLLATLGTNVARVPLTKVKEPAVMFDLMSLMKERRASPTHSDTTPVERNSGYQFKDRNRPLWSGRSRATNELRNDNDNDSTITTAANTTTFTTNTTNTTTNNTYNTINTSSSGKKITLEDKKAFLKTQEMRRRSIQRRSQSLANLAASTSPSPFLHSYPSTSSLPSPTAAAIDSLSVDTRPGFPWKKDRTTSQQSRASTPFVPAMSITIPLKVATVLQGMGYPINNANNATSPVCYSPSLSPSPTWSTPSTPRIIPSSLSSSSLSSLSSTSTVSSSSSYSSMSSSSKTLPLTFPDRLFQSRSPSHSPAGSSSVAMMPPPRSFSPRPMRATSANGAGTTFAPTSERYPYYSTASTMLPSLPSPVLSLTVPECQQQQQQQRVSNRPVDMDGYFRPRMFSGSRSEDEQSDASSPTTTTTATTTTTTSSRRHQHLLRPFEKTFVPPQRAGTPHSPWPSSSGSMTKSNSMPQLFPPQPPPSPSLSALPLSTADQDLEAPLDTTRYERVRHERSNSTSSIDRQLQQQQYYQITPQQEEQLMQSCSDNAPATQDVSFLTKRLANLQLMDTLCPVLVPEPVQHLQPQPQLQQGSGTMLDATWAMQIQLLLTHLAEQTDLEQESRPRPLPPPPRPLSLLLVLDDSDNILDKGAKTVEGVGLYKQVLTDWLLRLDQLSKSSSSSSSSSPSSSEMSLYQNHPGLKREVEKIRWQHNVPLNSKTIRSK